MNHITRAAFCGLRRLNNFRSHAPDVFIDWLQKRKWYDFKNINIFIGVNGGGKSTILELIESLVHPDRLVNLPRENQKGDMLTAFEIQLDDSFQFLAISVPNAIHGRARASNLDEEPHRQIDIQFLNVMGFRAGKALFSFEKNISKVKLDDESRNELAAGFKNCDFNVMSWKQGVEANIEDLVKALNKASIYLPGVLCENFEAISDYDKQIGALDYKKENPFHVHDENRVGIWLSDDTGQSNRIHVSTLPAGWRQLASISAWLTNCEPGTICLIEEPETHLHPRLQRYLAQEMDRIAVKNSLQLFISTHSTVFQQPNAWHEAPNIFEATSDSIVELTSSWRLLDALGIKGSDISQTNGIIWVEGPSDRLYIKHWLKIFCTHNEKKEPKENVDYSFAFYGGSLLSHVSLNDSDAFIDLLSINRNMLIVIDRDADFEEDCGGNLTPKNTNSAKARVLEKISSMDSTACHAWVTDGYTIESYLPKSFREQYFRYHDGRLVLLKGRKTSIAIEYAQIFGNFRNCTDKPEKLNERISVVFDAIACWGT